MNKKSNKFLSFIYFIITLIILLIFIVTSITALDILNVINIPEQYSLTRFLTTSREVSAKDYNNIVNENKEKSENLDEEEKIEQITQNAENIDKDTEAPLPEELQNMYESNNNLNQNNVQNNIERYYYSQLNEHGKIIYDNIYNNMEKLQTGTFNIDFDKQFNELLQNENGKAILENAFQSSLNALIYDNPKLFYIDITKMYLYTETTTVVMKKTYRVYIGPEEGKTYLAQGFNSEEDVKYALKQIEAIVENIKSSLTGTDYLKLKTIHNYLIDNIEYDKTISQPNIFNIYGALVNKVTVCEGYAKSFKYILDGIGIKSMFICGVGTNSNGQSESHAWNYVKLNGMWYAVDVTWDDPLIIGGGSLTDSYRYKYFLKGSKEFYKDHIEDGNIVEGVKFYYPVLNPDNY